MRLQQINLNNRIHVSLDGMEPEHYKSTEKGEGWYEFQMWHFMRIFGNNQGTGSYSSFSMVAYMEVAE